MSVLRELGRVPNLLSLVRVPLGALVWVAPANVAWVFTLLGLATISDLLDGWLARRMGIGAESIGAWLDPLCDKAFVASALVAVWLAIGPPWWLAAVAAARELIIAAMLLVKVLVPGLRRRVIPYHAMIAGKATTATQFLLFAAVMLGVQAAWPWLACLAGALGVVAGGQYLLRAIRTLATPL